MRKRLKRAFAATLAGLMKQNGLNHETLTAKLNARGARIRKAAIRAWTSRSDSQLSLPTFVNAVHLRDEFGVSLEYLFGLAGNDAQGDGMLYRILRNPRDRIEENIISVLSRLSAHYADTGRYRQLPLKTMFEFNSPLLGREDSADEIDRHAFHHLLAEDLADLNPKVIRRDDALEERLPKIWWQSGRKSVIEHACVFVLPNSTGQDAHAWNGFAEVMFLRCVADYLERTVFGVNTKIGVAGGKTIAGVFKMLRRTDKLYGCTFFPLIRHGTPSADAPITSSALVSDILFRMGGMGIKMPDGIDRKEEVRLNAETADVLLFSLGGSDYSSIINIIRGIRAAYDPEGRDKPRKAIAGDILFNVFMRSGRLLEEAVSHPEGDALEYAMARELAGPESEDDTGAYAQPRQDYRNYIGDVKFDLGLLKDGSREKPRRIVVVVAGTDKLEILNIFRKVACENNLRITLITEQSLAAGLLAGLEKEEGGRADIPIPPAGETTPAPA